VNQGLDPTLLPVALLIWPAAKSAVFVGSAAVSIWSRKPGRRAEARRIMRMISRTTGADRDQR
jgi:hypothetical protein